MSNPPFLSTSNLSVGYVSNGRKNILFDRINLSLFSGQVVCFMGPNGVGKSTLIRTLAGLQQPLSGTIAYADPQSSAPTPHENISVVLTDKITAVNFTAHELITFGRYPYLDWTMKLKDEDVAIIDRAIDQVNIRHLLEKRLYEMSDGQLQMVMIARALAQDSRVILLDEPTAHLDLNNRVEIMNLLRKISRSMNKAILVATHELDLALQTADLIWLAGREKTIHTGLPEDLVLDGSFDNIFQFKGFDLKTGKVLHEAHRNTQISLLGEGHGWLWTKNALERNGFEVVPSKGNTSVELHETDGRILWSVRKNNEITTVKSLAELINFL